MMIADVGWVQIRPSLVWLVVTGLVQLLAIVRQVQVTILPVARTNLH
jgi:hypothetical protein